MGTNGIDEDQTNPSCVLYVNQSTGTKREKKMGRSERKDVDYFPFFIKDGRTLFILESKYECKGTGFFTNLCRFLARTPDHHFQLEKESDLLFFLASTKCDEKSALDMIEIMVETEKLDRELWEQKKVIASQDFIDSIQDAYRKRKNECTTMEAIKDKFNITTGRKTLDIPISSAGKGENSGSYTQSKVKESKGKESILQPVSKKLIDSLKNDFPNIDIDFELDKYLHYQEERPKSKQHKNKERGFRNWIKQADKWRGDKKGNGGYYNLDQLLKEEENGKL